MCVGDVRTEQALGGFMSFMNPVEISKLHKWAYQLNPFQWTSSSLRFPSLCSS